MGKQRIVLEEVADPPLLRRHHDTLVGVKPESAGKTDAACLRPVQPSQAPQDGGLSRSRRPEKNGDVRPIRWHMERRPDRGAAVVNLLEVSRYLMGHTAHTLRFRA